MLQAARQWFRLRFALRKLRRLRRAINSAPGFWRAQGQERAVVLVFPIGGRVLRVLVPNGPEEIGEDRAKYIARDQQKRALVAIVKRGFCAFNQLPRRLLEHVVHPRNNGSERWTWSLDRDPSASGSCSRRILGRECFPRERRDHSYISDGFA